MLFGRAQQAPVVAVMAPLQTSPRCLMVHESSGITSFDDLKNMTIAMSTSSAVLAITCARSCRSQACKIVPYPGNVAQFLLNKDYAQQGYVFSEPFVARKEGGDPQVLMLSDLGFNPYTSLLFTTEDEIARAARVVRRMVAASACAVGHEYLESPEAANDADPRAESGDGRSTS